MTVVLRDHLLNRGRDEMVRCFRKGVKYLEL